jgi:hypothetical protein
MPTMRRMALRVAGAGVAWLLAAPAFAADAPATYPTMAPIAQYRMASREAEIALARSAAPASVSADADVLVFGPHGYETAVNGKNGFVCLVLRSWTAGLNDPVFWNPKIRGPACMNRAAARTELPHVFERTAWVLAGISRPAMIERTKTELAAKTYVMPDPGAMCFMMSKEAYLSDDGGHHWHPHLMFFVAAGAEAWGANLDGSPVVGGADDVEPVTTFMIPVAKWSDGSSQAMVMK